MTNRKSAITLVIMLVVLLLSPMLTARGLGSHTVYVAYNIRVDHTVSLAQLLKEGKYDYIDISDRYEDLGGLHGFSELIKKIPKRIDCPRTTSHVALEEYRDSITTGDILLDLNEKGWRPATLRELLVFGSTYPDMQRKYTIVALGTSWPIKPIYLSNNFKYKGGYVGVLASTGKKRYVAAIPLRGTWSNVVMLITHNEDVDY